MSVQRIQTAEYYGKLFTIPRFQYRPKDSSVFPIFLNLFQSLFATEIYSKFCQDDFVSHHCRLDWFIPNQAINIINQLIYWIRYSNRLIKRYCGEKENHYNTYIKYVVLNLELKILVCKPQFKEWIYRR